MKTAERPVILGNHRDAWVFGAADPNSGTASMLELARGLGVLLSRGWRPQRTLLLCSWSGEELGLLGSTAWAEANADLVQSAVAYLNVDMGVSGGALVAKGTYALRSALEDVIGVVGRFEEVARGPPTRRRVGKKRPGVPDEDLLDTTKPVLRFFPAGSGSDFTVFLAHFGVASLDIAFEREGANGHNLAPYGQYHSIYDSFHWMDRFGGGAATGGIVGESFELLSRLAQIWGLLALRLADARVLPFNHTAQAQAMRGWAQHLGKKLDVHKLEGAIDAYETASLSTELQEGRRINIDTSTFSRSVNASLSSLNDRLAFTERQFLSKKGLPGRKWFRSLLQAPGLDDGYGAQAFPGVEDGMRMSRREGRRQLEILIRRTRRAAAFLSGDDSFLEEGHRVDQEPGTWRQESGGASDGSIIPNVVAFAADSRREEFWEPDEEKRGGGFCLTGIIFWKDECQCAGVRENKFSRLMFLFDRCVFT